MNADMKSLSRLLCGLGGHRPDTARVAAAPSGRFRTHPPQGDLSPRGRPDGEVDIRPRARTALPQGAGSPASAPGSPVHGLQPWSEAPEEWFDALEELPDGRFDAKPGPQVQAGAARVAPPEGPPAVVVTVSQAPGALQVPIMRGQRASLRLQALQRQCKRLAAIEGRFTRCPLEPEGAESPFACLN